MSTPSGPPHTAADLNHLEYAMKRTVWTFGLISGGIFAVMMIGGTLVNDRIGFDTQEIIGYTTMVVSFLLVYFGVRSYRDNVLDGTITFGRAVRVGFLITLVSSVCYVAAWQLVYYRLAPDFGQKYAAHMLDKAAADGATPAQLEVKRREMAEFQEMYKNPLVNIGLTLLEPMPVGLLLTLVSAGVLSRRRKGLESPGGVSTRTA